MANIGWGHVLAAGLNGYMEGDRAKTDRAEQKEKREAEKEERQLRLADVRREAGTRQALVDAARPVAVQEGAGGMIKPDSMDNRDVGLPENAELPNGGLSLANYSVGGKTFTDRAPADAAAAGLNAPDAVATRQAQALRAGGKPMEALSLDNAVTTQKQAAAKFTADQMKRARELQEEGYLDAAKAARTGDAQGVFDTFNKNGKIKLQGVPTVTPAERDIPGVGKIPTYDFSGTVIGADGTPKPFKMNSHDFSMQAMPYEKALEFQRKATDTDSKHQARVGQLEVAGQKVELAGAVAEARIAAAQARAAKGGDGVSKEERLRYTSLFSEAGRRVGEAQKALGTLQKDIVFMSQAAKPGSAQAEQLAEVKAAVASHSEERQLYQGLLAGSQGVKGASLADAEKPSKAAKASGPVAVTSKAERDKLPKGTKYQGPDGQTYIKQ